MKILFVSLGCDKNLVDSEEMLGALRERGYQFTDDETEADAAIVNTCCFIMDAQKESIEQILALAERRTEGTLKALIVTGCMAQRYKDEVLGEIPEVDAVIGTTSEGRIADILDEGVELAVAPQMLRQHEAFRQRQGCHEPGDVVLSVFGSQDLLRIKAEDDPLVVMLRCLADRLELLRAQTMGFVHQNVGIERKVGTDPAGKTRAGCRFVPVQYIPGQDRQTDSGIIDGLQTAGQIAPVKDRRAGLGRELPSDVVEQERFAGSGFAGQTEPG